MRVVESGKSKGTGKWTKQVVCTGRGHGGGGCEAKLEITNDDVYPNDGRQRGYHFRCPECHNDTAIQLPAQIKQRVDARYDPD